MIPRVQAHMYKIFGIQLKPYLHTLPEAGTPLFIHCDPRFLRGFVEVDLGYPWLRYSTHYQVIARDKDVRGRRHMLIIDGPGETDEELQYIIRYRAEHGDIEVIAPDDIRIPMLVQLALFPDTSLGWCSKLYEIPTP